MAPGTRSKFGAPMFEPELFRKQMYCFEESTCDFVGTFRRPVNCTPFVTPLVFVYKSFPVFLRYNTERLDRGRNEVKWHSGQEASLAPPCLNLRSFGSKCTVLKKVFVTLLGVFGAPRSDSAPGNCAPLVTPLG